MSVNSISMASSMLSCNMIDSEHQRIMRQLRAYGVEPTGDKSVDKAKLQKVEESKQNQNAQLSNNKSNKEMSENKVSENQAESKSEGADQIAMLNKLKLGLL